MTVTHSTIVPINATAPSDVIVVDEGKVVKVGIFSAVDGTPVPGTAFIITEQTTGKPNYVGSLEAGHKSHLLDGPGAYIITPPTVPGHGFGAYKAVSP